MSFETITGKREILLDVMRSSRLESSRLYLSHANSVTELIPPEGEISLVWKQKPLGGTSDLPEVIIGSRSSLEDLIAWSTTYIHGLGALSANSRILLPDEVDLLFQTEIITAPPQLSALAALILAEAVVLTEPTASINSLSILACKSTLSFASVRALAFGKSIDFKLSEQWERAHRIVNPTSRAIGLITPVIHACSAAVQMLQDKRPEGAITRIGLWLKEIALRGEVQPVLLSEVVMLIGESRYESQIRSFFDLTPADRVRVFDELMPKFREQQKLPRMERAFAVAVLASVCRPGLLQQISFLRDALFRIQEVLPEAILFLAVVQGLHGKNDVLEFAEGLGRRIVRELMHREWISDRPRSDISLIELEILAKGSSLFSLRTNDPSHINVELQPGISTVVKWNPRPSLEQKPYTGDLPFATMEANDPIEELSKTLRKASDLLSVLKRDFRNPTAYKKRGTRRH
jgi:hypothetical protein